MFSAPVSVSREDHTKVTGPLPDLQRYVVWVALKFYPHNTIRLDLDKPPPTLILNKRIVPNSVGHGIINNVVTLIEELKPNTLAFVVLKPAEQFEHESSSSLVVMRPYSSPDATAL